MQSPIANLELKAVHFILPPSELQMPADDMNCIGEIRSRWARLLLLILVLTAFHEVSAQQYLVVNIIPGENYKEVFEQARQLQDQQSASPVRLGIGAIFSYLNEPRDLCKEHVLQFLSLSEKYDIPVVVQLDGEQWWDGRPDLWNWWDPEHQGYSPANRINVEWTGWGSENAMKIAWRNWGRQIRVLPPPNLVSPSYRKACHDEMRALIPVVLEWWKRLPNEKKSLLIGIKIGWESSIGVNAFYYPNGNDLLDRPESEDPQQELKGEDVPDRGVVASGYAAVTTAGLAGSGPLQEKDLAEIVRRHLEDLCGLATELGVPREKMFTHVGGWKEEELLYDAAFNKYSCPGWSFYRHAGDPSKDKGVQRALQNSDAPYWGAVEWMLMGTDNEQEWLDAISRTLSIPKCRYMCIYNWTGIKDNRGAVAAVRTALATGLKSGQDGSGYPPAGELKTSSPVYLRGLEQWNKHRSIVREIPGVTTQKRIELEKKCIFTLLNNRQGPRGGLKHEGVYPSYKDFRGFWAWDSWKHAYALASFAPELAKNNVRAMFDYQDTCGMVADCIFIDTAENNYRDTKPPLASWAVLEIFKHTSDTAFVKEMFPRLLTYHRWWYSHRDHDQNGLCEYGSTDGTIQAARWESGWDNAVRFDSATMLQNNSHAWSMNQESADLNSYLYIEKLCLADLAFLVERASDASGLREEARALSNRIRTLMWDESEGFFFDVSVPTKKKVKVLEPNGWIPLWAGVATESQAQQIRRHVMNPAEFNTLVPCPTVAANSAGFSPEKGYWRGPVWLDQAHFAIRGLRNYGFTRDADELTAKILKNCEGLLQPGVPIRENYDPLTGKGLNAENFSWSAAHLLMMIRETTE